MSSIEDTLFAPILPSSAEDKLKDIIRRVMNTPRSDTYTDAVTKEIVDLLQQHGFTNDKDIADVVRRVIKEMTFETSPTKE